MINNKYTFFNKTLYICTFESDFHFPLILILPDSLPDQIRKYDQIHDDVPTQHSYLQTINNRLLTYVKLSVITGFEYRFFLERLTSISYTYSYSL